MAFEKKLMEDGSINPNYVDLLDEDKEISPQKFCCVSFVSPENILKQKRLFQFEKFLKYYDSIKRCKNTIISLIMLVINTISTLMS